MEWLQYVVAVVYLVLGAAGVVLVVFQLPGTWFQLAVAGVIEFADRLYLPAGTWTFDGRILLACLLLACIGEAIEFFAGVLGARQAGASRRGMIGSLIGGILGIFVFTPVFFFMPLFGALLGAILGTFLGAVIGELTADQATMKGAIRPALGATIGRVLGTMSKVGIAMVLWLVLTVSAFWPS